MDVVPIGLNRQHDARARGLTVEQNRAGAAHAVLASDMGAGQTEILPDKIAEQQPRLHVTLVLDAVHTHSDRNGRAHQT